MSDTIVPCLGALSNSPHEPDAFFSIGTSGVVEPAASLPYEALRHGATVVEVNLDETPLTPHATFALRGPAGKVLPVLLRAAWKKNQTNRCASLELLNACSHCFHSHLPSLGDRAV